MNDNNKWIDIMLKDPNAPESKSVNKLDYSIIFNELFYKFNKYISCFYFSF